MSNVIMFFIHIWTRKSLLWSQCISILCALAVTPHTHALVTSLQVSPNQQLVLTAQNVNLNIRWQIGTDAGHSSGITSSNARILNPQTGAVLTTLGGLLSSGGTGPFIFNETLPLSATDTSLWFSQGLRNVVLTRTFSDPAGGAGRDIRLNIQLSQSRLSAIRESTSGELNVLGLSFEFDNGTVLTQVDQASPLQGDLTLNYTGTGLLEGRWQIAEPAGSYEEPLYRTLAIVRKNINANQRTTFQSPLLPTINTGKYLLRFCVSNKDMRMENSAPNELCPYEDLIVHAAYQVKGNTPKFLHISGIQPNQEKVNERTLFSWNPLPQTTVYQLQIFDLVPTKASLASSKDNTETVKPEFVVGMVLKGGITQTPLSDLVLSKLQSGKNYLWRVTAHNEMGHVLGGSHEATFSYQAHIDEDKQNAQLEGANQ